MSLIKQAVILAGGKGKRLLPLTLTKPKPMVEIHGKPFLEHLIEMLKKNDIEEVVILTGYLHKQIEQYLHDGRRWGLKIKYSHSPVEDETGTRIRRAKHFLRKKFLLLYSDNYWPLQLDKMFSFYLSKDVLAMVTVYNNRYGFAEYGFENNIFVDSNGIIQAYDRKRSARNLNATDIGFFILDKSIVNFMPYNNFSFEKELLPLLISKSQLAGYRTDYPYYFLTTRDRVPMMEEYFRKKKILFLDRDGVINKNAQEHEYIIKWKDFVFLPKVKEALQLAQQKGYKMFVITNQAGVAHGKMTKKTLEDIHKNMQLELRKIGVTFDDIFVCTHATEDNCFCRKPNPGMFFQAATKHHINLFESYCIGDDERDMMAATTAGVKTFLVNKKENLYSIVEKHL